jgi:cell division protein FtsB
VLKLSQCSSVLQAWDEVDTSAAHSYDPLMHGYAADLSTDDVTSLSGATSASSVRTGGGPALPFTRRRLAMLVAGLFALWLIGVFARQVGDASTASSQADQLRARNAAMERDVASLEVELKLIGQPAFVSQMARGYNLGSPREIPFTIDPNAPPLPADAAGSTGIKPEQPTHDASPLDSWMQALFGTQK